MAADGHWYRRSRWRDLIRIALRPDLPRGVSSCALHLAIAASNTCGGMGLRLWRPGAGLRARKPGAAPTRFGVLASRCSFRKLIRHTCQSMQLGHTHRTPSMQTCTCHPLLCRLCRQADAPHDRHPSASLRLYKEWGRTPWNMGRRVSQRSSIPTYVTHDACMSYVALFSPLLLHMRESYCPGNGRTSVASW